MYCILYLLSGLIRIRRNSSLGPQELCQSKSCLSPSTQSQLELHGERRRRHKSLPPACAATARRSREEGRWKKRAWKGPHWIWLLSSIVQSTRLRSLQSKRGCFTEAEAAEPFSTVTEFGKLRGVGSNEDPNRCLEKKGSKELRRWRRRRWRRRWRRRRRRREVNSQSFESFLWRSVVNKRRARRGTQRFGGASAQWRRRLVAP